MGLERCLLRLESSMHILLKFFGINNGMKFIFSSFWTYSKKLIHVIIESIHTNFVLLQLSPHVYIMFTHLGCKHCIKTFLKFSLKIRV
jgi:hypothetical protein